MQRPSWRKVLFAAGLIPAVALSPLLLRRVRPVGRAMLGRSTDRLRGVEPLTAATLAGELWGAEEANSHSPGAQRVRTLARELFPDQAPGHGGEWRFTAAQVTKLKAHLDAN
ncbi:MAG TPA: hypothetical protein VHX66_11995 [Solirubrobacteraceae bacterium]|jgi:hypothetical protein|nr:hypothetical protein [Solirubrobacteraceae bacterium]